ncbi:MAG: InlB B-repeat-containing protein [Bacilli bacterium]|nr:InlB B-repeat-containing protein [Bacilli bacterium]
MKIKKTMTLFLILITTFILLGCQDKKTYNDSFIVIFYTGLDTTNVESSRIDPIRNVKYGDLVSKPDDPTAPGANFLGWYKEKSTENKWDFEKDIVTQSVVLYSKWEMIDLKIEYIFDDAGGELIDEPIYSYSVLQSIILPKADRNGSIFLGWILTPVEKYHVGDKIIKTTNGYSNDLLLYALFDNKEYTVRFRSLLDGVSNPKTYTIKYASEINFPLLPDTETKKFAGWFIEDGSENGNWGYEYINGDIFLGKAISYNSETMEWEFVVQNVTLYAKWENK